MSREHDLPADGETTPNPHPLLKRLRQVETIERSLSVGGGDLERECIAMLEAQAARIRVLEGQVSRLKAARLG